MTDVVFSGFSLFMRTRTEAQGIALPTFRVSLPTSFSLIKIITKA